MSGSVKTQSELQVGMSSDKVWSVEESIGVPQSNLAVPKVEHLIRHHSHVGRSRCLVPLVTDSYRTAVGSKSQLSLHTKTTYVTAIHIRKGKFDQLRSFGKSNCRAWNLKLDNEF